MFPDNGPPIEVVFPPHVEPALACLLVAFLIASGLAVYMIIEWLGEKK